MNPIAEQMTGWPAGEAVGQRVEHVFDIVAEAGPANRCPNPVAECLRGRSRICTSTRTSFSSAERRRAATCATSASPVRTPQGKVIGAVLVFQDVTHSRALQRKLAHSAMHDSLTGLPNRPAFERALADASDQARRELREHALCFIDLDRFKTVNDSAGHAAGDALLRQIADVIRRSCRTQDFTARIGGDEFALLLADCSLMRRAKAAQQVIDAIAASASLGTA